MFVVFDVGFKVYMLSLLGFWSISFKIHSMHSYFYEITEVLIFGRLLNYVYKKSFIRAHDGSR